MYYEIKNQYLLMVFLSILFIQSFFIITLADKILPSKYFYDAETIRIYFSYVDNSSFELFNSFLNTAKFYSFLGFDHFDSKILERYFSYLLIYSALVFLFIYSKIKLSWSYAAIVLIWNIPLSIYLGQLSKDAISFITITLILLLCILRKKPLLIMTLLILVVYGLIFRSYWLIYGYFVLINYIVLFQNNHIKKRVVKFSLLMLCIILLFLIADLSGTILTDIRTHVNLYRQGSIDANTIINNYIINKNFVTDFLNWLISLSILIVPIPLLKNMGILSLIFVLWNLTNILLLIKIYNKQKKNTENYYTYKKIKILYSLLLGYIFVQAIFEPDLGSFLRHQLAIIPICFYLIGKFLYKET